MAKRERRGYRALAWTRLCVASAILALFVRVFTSSLLQWRGVRAFLMDGQFSGALARGGVFAAVVILWVAVALLFGRWFCSVGCPFGTAQEVVWRLAQCPLGRKKKQGKTFSRHVSPWRLRYLLPLLAGVELFFFVSPLSVLADPISNFGRGVRSVLVFITEGAASPVTWVMLALFLVILTAAALRGRRFCDWCPVGTLLGLCSRAAPFGMKIDRHACVSCGICEGACPTRCVDVKRKTLERDRCVLCLSCASSCSVGALGYGFVPLFEKTKNVVERRTFLQKSGFALAYLAGLTYLAGPTLRALKRSERGRAVQEDSTDFIDRVLPPGAKNAEHFAARCIGCQACVSACPVGIVRADESFRPRLDYTRGYCQYNCTECGHVCPTEALFPLSRDEKQRTRIALSAFTRANCVVITRQQSCGACAEVCPTHALRMIPTDDGSSMFSSNLTVPVFDADYCIGCGGCLNVCPAVPKAFTVKGVFPHPRTPGMRPAEQEDTETFLPVVSGDDFPF